MPEVPSPAVASRLARALLSPLGRRWDHVQGVAARSTDLAPAVQPSERALLVVAAWWHDLGYAPSLHQTGMHQIDGARFLEDLGYPNRLVALVAHHSAAGCEAEERGLVAELGCWPREQSAVADALWTADMTTDPDGRAVEYPDRLAEILSRYDSDSTVGRAMTAARPSITEAIDRTVARLSG